MTNTLVAVAFCGPSGVGKGTLLRRLLSEFKDKFAYSVSHTTRAPRAHEVNGKDYYFTDRQTMMRMFDSHEFLEMCDVHGNLYGTSIATVQAVQKEGKICIIEMDVKGASKLRQIPCLSVNIAYLFITAPIDDLRDRIMKRGADDLEALERRLTTAKAEFEFLSSHPGFFSSVIVNDDVEKAYEDMIAALNKEFGIHGMPLLEFPAKAM